VISLKKQSTGFKEEILAMLKINCIAGRQWLMPVILATQEAEFRRIQVLKPAQANSPQIPI
jgi:hypothetical protein